jgi:hypothetical protein
MSNKHVLESKAIAESVQRVAEAAKPTPVKPVGFSVARKPVAPHLSVSVGSSVSPKVLLALREAGLL